MSDYRSTGDMPMTQIVNDSFSNEALIDAVIAACDGDMREAIKALLLLNLRPTFNSYTRRSNMACRADVACSVCFIDKASMLEEMINLSNLRKSERASGSLPHRPFISRRRLKLRRCDPVFHFRIRPTLLRLCDQSIALRSRLHSVGLL
jgi:hypothetical protein